MMALLDCLRGERQPRSIRKNSKPATLNMAAPDALTRKNPPCHRIVLQSGLPCLGLVARKKFESDAQDLLRGREKLRHWLKLP